MAKVAKMARFWLLPDTQYRSPQLFNSFSVSPGDRGQPLCGQAVTKACDKAIMKHFRKLETKLLSLNFL